MMRCQSLLVAVLLGALAFARMAHAQDDDDDQPPAAANTTQPALNAEQQGAVGIVVAHPRAVKTPQSIQAYGQVLDPAVLVADAGQLDTARAAERATGADLARLQALYRGQAGASLKMLQGAQAEQVRAQAQVDLATATFALRWGPLAKSTTAIRQELVSAVATGKRLLVRADLPGRRSIGELPTAAQLDVDGVAVPAKVLGVMSQSGDAQSVGVLLQVDAAPAGFGAGARVPVTLEGAARSGVLVPAGALIYGEQGTHVYCQLAAKTPDGKVQYAAIAVTLLQPQGDAWLVSGIDDGDLVVVRGAGVLWSLQGLGAVSDDDDD